MHTNSPSTDHRHRHPDDRRTLSARLRTTAVAVTAVVLIATFAAGVAAHAAGPGPVDPTAIGATSDGTPPPPPPPGPGEMVGVLDLFGNPVLGPGGQPLAVPLRPPSPRLPANATAVHPPGGTPATPESVEVDLLTAHARTLNEVANDEHYTLTQRFDLFLANGLVTSTNGQSSSLAAYRGLLVTLDQQTASGQTAAACATAATARAQADGVPADLIGGPSRPQLHAEVVRTGDLLACPA